MHLFQHAQVFLEIYLKERPRLADLHLKGVKSTEKEDVEEKLNIRRGSQITDNVLNNAQNIIKKHYIEKGFFNVETTVIMEVDTVFQNRVNVTIKVDKNDKVKIQDIYFEGNTDFTTERLRRVMKNTKKKNLNIFKGSKYVGYVKVSPTSSNTIIVPVINSFK